MRPLGPGGGKFKGNSVHATGLRKDFGVSFLSSSCESLAVQARSCFDAIPPDCESSVDCNLSSLVAKVDFPKRFCESWVDRNGHGEEAESLNA